VSALPPNSFSLIMWIFLAAPPFDCGSSVNVATALMVLG
jgi:hypothetical protein